MQEALFRTGFSTIIRESHDASCAVLTSAGDVAAQHIVLPLHLGVFPVSIRAVLERYPADNIRDGDAFLVNHPYIGGSPHAPDMCVVVPVFVDKKLAYFTASIAHKSDIGGSVPGVALVKRPTFTQREFISHPYALCRDQRDFSRKSRRDSCKQPICRSRDGRHTWPARLWLAGARSNHRTRR